MWSGEKRFTLPADVDEVSEGMKGEVGQERT